MSFAQYWAQRIFDPLIARWSEAPSRAQKTEGLLIADLIREMSIAIRYTRISGKKTEEKRWIQDLPLIPGTTRINWDATVDLINSSPLEFTMRLRAGYGIIMTQESSYIRVTAVGVNVNKPHIMVVFTYPEGDEIVKWTTAAFTEHRDTEFVLGIGESAITVNPVPVTAKITDATIIPKTE